jgi:Protein of unknown function (DUF3071)
MRQLRLVAVDEDGTHLILAGDDGAGDLRLPIDERLHAALRGDRARLGQLAIQLESQLRPREIQARVRGGESVESVAQAAGVPVDRILRFAGPVLDEREHVAARARRAALRRPGVDGPAPLLEDSVVRRVAEQGHDPEQVAWDAWRRGDGRWVVSAGWRAGAKSRSAQFVFDPAGRSVLPDDDEARYVAGEKPPPPAPPAPTRPARLSVVPGDDDPGPQPPRARRSVDEGDPVSTALAFGTDPSGAEGPGGLPEAPATEAVEDALPADHVEPDDDEATGPVPLAPAARQVDDSRLRLSDIARHVEEDDEHPDLDEPLDAARPAAGEGHHALAGGGRARRPSVPTWDEIMFGRRRKGD